MPISLHLPSPFIDLQPVLLLLTNVLFLALGPRHRIIQLSLSVPTLVLLVAQSLYREWELGWGLHYGLNCFVATCVAHWVDWVAVGSPDKEKWRKLERRGVGKVEGMGVRGRDVFPADEGAVMLSRRVLSQEKGERKEKTTVPTSFCTRLWWATCLSTTTRYTGWTAEVANVPSSVAPSYSRWKFFVRKLCRALLFYTLKDAIYAHTASSPHGTWLDLYPQSPVVGFSHTPFPQKLYWTWIYIALTYISLEFANTVYSLLAVATYLAQPHDCPRMFGDLSRAYNVRNAWGTVWHQQMRRFCGTPGVWLALDVLKLRKGSFQSRYVQLFTGFAISAAIHAAAAVLTHGTLRDDGAVKAFMFQAGFIFVEDQVVALGKWCGISGGWGWRVVGYVWTFLAIGSGMMDWTGRMLGSGLWVHKRESDFLGLGPG